MRIIPRDEWCDIPARANSPRMVLPSRELYVHHGAAGTSTIATARQYARFHINTRGWNDIGYQFLVAEGQALEGRGAGVIGAQVAGRNSISQGIVIVGDYRSKAPADRDLDAVAELVAHGHREGWWPAGLTGGHGDAPGATTSCPGLVDYRDINRRLTTVSAASEEEDLDVDEATLRKIIREEVGLSVWGFKGRAPGGEGQDPDDAYAYLRSTKLDLDHIVPRFRRTIREMAAKLGVKSEV